jgi:hypothetical protein
MSAAEAGRNTRAEAEASEHAAPTLASVRKLMVAAVQEAGVEASQPRANNEALDSALDAGTPDLEWTAKVAQGVAERLRLDASIVVDDVKCTSAFCRVKLTKPIHSVMDWPQVDTALLDVAVGETVFRAEPNGETTTGYLYFSSAHSHLPI